MPLYEYECDVNGHRFEVIRKFSDPPVDQCPQCGSPVHKLFSSPAIQFKGSGFYITDYAKKDSGGADKSGATKETKADKASGAAEKSDSSAKSDSPSAAPATASDTTPKSTKSDS